jgi:predicted nucleic acid-binding protein
VSRLRPERRGDTIQVFLHRVIEMAGDQEAALSAVGVVELIHGIHRADTPERRARREAFVEELFAAVAIYPLTTDVAKLAGKLDAEQQKRGVVIPFADLLDSPLRRIEDQGRCTATTTRASRRCRVASGFLVRLDCPSCADDAIVVQRSLTMEGAPSIQRIDRRIRPTRGSSLRRVRRPSQCGRS